MPPTADEILLANLAATRFPSLSVDVALTHTFHGGPSVSAKSRTLSRFEATPDGRWKFDIMSRVTEGQPFNGRFLIEQRSGGSASPLTWVLDPTRGAARQYAYQPWQPFAGSALRWMDYIIPPPGTFTAALNPGATPSDPTWVLPAPCWVVDLTLDRSFWKPEPRLERLWIEQTPGRALDHRVEQHLSDGSVRVIGAANWAQFKPGGPWGPTLRTVDDPVVDTRTMIAVVSAYANPLDPRLFDPITMAEQDW
ncbi:MAG TPA: hypothetical protein VL403_19545 [Candidatus Kryptonia bacterium]|nr:hypothetical protein [Candidatus Kryptonia bacterium]